MATTDIKTILRSTKIKSVLASIICGSTAATQDQVDAGTATGVYVEPATLENSSQLSGKQSTLVSGTNIKTINGSSILGSGDLTVSGGGLSGLTATRIPYAQDSTTLIDSSALTWDNTNSALTINSQRIGRFTTTAVNGENGLYIGNGAGVQTTFTVSRLGNTAVGTQAMASIADGSNFYDGAYNAAFGYKSMNANTTGGYNAAFGYGSMQANVTGIQSAAFGYFAMRYQTGGSNTAFGYLALQGASGQSTGTDNTALGRTALSVLTTGTRNVGVGPCLQAVTSGNYNVGVGSECFERVTTTHRNVGIGIYTGTYNRGTSNTAVGSYSLGQTTSDSASNIASFNTFLGDSAGYYHAIGNYNTWLGYLSGTTSQITINKSIAIGYNAAVTVDSSCVIGGLADADRVNYGFGGESYGSGLGVAFFKNAVTNATTSPTSGTIIHARNSSDTASTLALFTEQAVEAIGTFTPSHKLKVWINNTEYWIQLDAV